MNNKKVVMSSFRVLGTYLTISNTIHFLNTAIITRNIVGNVEGVTTYTFGLLPFFIMSLLGLSIYYYGKSMEKSMVEKTENVEAERIMIGLLLIISSFSSILHLIALSIRSYLSIRSILPGNEGLHSVLLKTYLSAMIESGFFVTELLIGLGFLMGWFKRIKGYLHKLIID